MHRTFSLTVPPSVTEPLCQQLLPLPEVIGLSVQLGGSRKPAGDVITLQVLNRGADEVLRRARAAVARPEDLAIATAELASLIAPADKERIDRDNDQAIWEEMSAGLRYQARLSPNFFMLMFLGGILAAVGLVSAPVPQAVAFIASSIIAPAFEPLAKVPLGLVLRRWALAWQGVLAALLGYGVLILAAGLTTALLLHTRAASVADLVTNPEVASLRFPDLKALLVAGTGAVAGILVLAAFRRSVIAGPLIALALMPAAALVGAGLAAGRTALAWHGLERTGADVGFVLVAGLVVFGLKQVVRHRRQPLQ